MTFIAPTSDSQMSGVYSAALCAEIGERLRISLGQRPVEMSPHLLLLVDQLRRQYSLKSI
jgi:hypothetical protein